MKVKMSTIQKHDFTKDDALYNEVKQGLDDLVNGRFTIWKSKTK